MNIRITWSDRPVSIDPSSSEPGLSRTLLAPDPSISRPGAEDVPPPSAFTFASGSRGVRAERGAWRGTGTTGTTETRSGRKEKVFLTFW